MGDDGRGGRVRVVGVGQAQVEELADVAVGVVEDHEIAVRVVGVVRIIRIADAKQAADAACAVEA